jgi:small-conductance mechanosensitive channel
MVFRLVFLLITGLLLNVAGAAAQGAAKGGRANAHPEMESRSAAVELDGVELFRVRGTEFFPAEERAAGIVQRIVALADDPSFRTDALRTMDSDLGVEIAAGNQRVMVVTDADAKLEGVNRRELGAVILARVRSAVDRYREARTPENLTRSALRALIATAIVAVLTILLIWSARRGMAALERRYQGRIRSVAVQSFQILRRETLWRGLRGSVGFLRFVAVLTVLLLYLQYVLALFPSTQSAGHHLAGYVLGPLQVLAQGIMAHIPGLIFLAILFFITRYALKLVRLYFDAVERGTVTLSGFDREWAQPTYRLVRVGIVAFALVVAYPYIPGSRSDAFKGITIFAGILFSLGSSSAIANIIAGYMMTYRRAFKVNDRVRIGDVTGDVTEMRVQVTHLKTIKNEEVIVPNSSILSREVVNYSSYARRHGLVLHTEVGIGYETPWRQVEGMLLCAAERTRGLLKEPPPFVHQKKLGDFAVTYELNAYCADAQQMEALYTEMHRSILDIFNEYGVQIMTPAYERDPPTPKIVPKEAWFAEPSRVLQVVEVAKT